MALVQLCYETLLEDGKAAVLAVQAHICTKALENIIKDNTYLSRVVLDLNLEDQQGIVLFNGFTVIEATHKLYHGEKVTFGTFVQLILENAPKREIEEVIQMCQSVGLPTTLCDLNIIEINPKEIMECKTCTST